LPEIKDILGLRFGRLIVLKLSKNQKIGYGAAWICKCDCGNIKEINGKHLRSGLTKSCGCWQKEVMLSINLIHGFKITDVEKDYRYSTYRGMIKRCYDEKAKNYKNYGGRGIRVCSSWLKSIFNFINDIGERPTKYHTLDRIENNGNYTPQNCKWSTRKEQIKNRRKHGKFICAK